jgi:hypothetical protein
MIILNRGANPVKDWYAVVQHPGFSNFSTAYSVAFTPDLGALPGCSRNSLYESRFLLGSFQAFGFPLF